MMNCRLLVMVLLCMSSGFGLLKDLVRARSALNPVPENVADVYDPETYARWRKYHAEKCRLAMIQKGIGFAVSAVLLLTNAYAAFAQHFAPTPNMQAFAVVLLSVLAGLSGIPGEYWDTMRIEEKYGFNRTGRKTFWLDQLKQMIISLGLMSGIAMLLLWLHRALGDWVILAFAGALALIILIFSFLYPFFSRIFNRFTPLEDGELKDRLTALLEKHGYRVRAIQVMDASRRSTKANAYFSGFGKTKTIVLYDTLVQSMTPDEILAVFGHEMGHGVHRDTLKQQALGFLQVGVLAVLAWLTLRTVELFTAFGFTEINYGFALLLIMEVEFACLSPFFGLITNAYSRHCEYRADAFAAKEGYGEALISGLKKLARANFAELAPSDLLVKLDYSHPPMHRRIDAIRKAAGGRT